MDFQYQDDGSGGFTDQQLVAQPLRWWILPLRLSRLVQTLKTVLSKEHFFN